MKDIKNKKVFVIINSYRIGDILLTNSLVQNIKRIYEDAFVVMLTSPALVDIAKYQKGVDDVVIWDRHGIHKGAFNTIKFAFKFPYKKVYAAFPIYGMDRPLLLSKLLGAKYIIAPRRSAYSDLFRKSKYQFNVEGSTVQQEHVNLLSGITKEKLIDVPVIYNAQNVSDYLIPNEEYVVICPTSSKKEKDMPIELLIETIAKIEKHIVLIGKGSEADIISERLKQEKFPNLIDLTGKTSILEMADVINKSLAVITVDTGTLHLSVALQKPTIALFYTKGTERFIPNPSLYNCTVLENKSSENISLTLKNILKSN